MTMNVRFLITFRISSLGNRIVDTDSLMSFLCENCRKIPAGIKYLSLPSKAYDKLVFTQ